MSHSECRKHNRTFPLLTQWQHDSEPREDCENGTGAGGRSARLQKEARAKGVDGGRCYCLRVSPTVAPHMRCRSLAAAHSSTLRDSCALYLFSHPPKSSKHHVEAQDDSYMSGILGTLCLLGYLFFDGLVGPK